MTHERPVPLFVPAPVEATRVDVDRRVLAELGVTAATLAVGSPVAWMPTLAEIPYFFTVITVAFLALTKIERGDMATPASVADLRGRRRHLERRRCHKP